ncbi:hypothetical protein EVAR_7713_1 [Eumeta japonica]|uniref:Uncharacterized protein n=1 Tax=Eumeta variegata TaxID=151549 RepID=A0A4C1TLH2_EUMVA|nr:hypothetical protein EVAR_7713_1 [Eumeta japonica]
MYLAPRRRGMRDPTATPSRKNVGKTLSATLLNSKYRAVCRFIDRYVAKSSITFPQSFCVRSSVSELDRCGSGAVKKRPGPTALRAFRGTVTASLRVAQDHRVIRVNSKSSVWRRAHTWRGPTRRARRFKNLWYLGCVAGTSSFIAVPPPLHLTGMRPP